MNNFKKAAIAVLLAGSVAYAADLTIQWSAQVFRSGFWSGATAAKTAGNKVTGVYEGSVTTDFANTTIQCEDSDAITVTGAQVGDPCFVGIDSATVNAAHSHFSCYALANQAKVRHCPAGTATNPAEAVYRVRVISSR